MIFVHVSGTPLFAKNLLEKNMDPNMDGFIAQSAEHRTSDAKAMGSILVGV